MVENWGDSPLATRLGVAQYPAVFVNDAVFATPRDLGFYGRSQQGGRYTPWLEPESHARFRDDLVRMVDRALAGEILPSAAPASAPALATLPAFRVTDLAGKPLAAEDLRNKAVLVEFWATWCPPCQSTLEFLDKLSRERKDLAIVAFAVESEEQDVRARTAKLEGVRVALGSPEIASAFGDLLAVPTLYLFSPEGKLAATFYGSPPDLHDRVGRSIDALGAD